MGHKVHRPLQRQHGHIEPIGLRCEFEVRMHVDRPHAEGVGGQRLDRRVDHVVAEGHVHLPWGRARNAVARGHHVPARNQRTPASGKHRPVCYSVSEERCTRTHSRGEGREEGKGNRKIETSGRKMSSRSVTQPDVRHSVKRKSEKPQFCSRPIVKGKETDHCNIAVQCADSTGTKKPYQCREGGTKLDTNEVSKRGRKIVKFQNTKDTKTKNSTVPSGGQTQPKQ